MGRFNMQAAMGELRAEQLAAMGDLRAGQVAMREEQRGDHRELSEKVDRLRDLLHDYDTRLVTVENTRSSMRWLGATMVVTVLSALADFFFVHLPKFLGKQ